MIGGIISNIESVVVFVAVLSVLIIVHEWGHFITAKRLGIDVQRFALGFGPTLYSKKYNGTSYMINAIPLGGYVKMAGDERSECTGKPDEFLSKSAGCRALVVLNGPVVNFILAYISFVFVFMLGYPGHSATIKELESGGPAQIAGLQTGDQIIAIESRKTYGWMNIESRLEGAKEGPVEVAVLRKGEEITKTVYPKIVSEPNIVGRFRMVRDLGLKNVLGTDALPSVVGGLSANYPAENAGLEVGDRIIEINTQKVSNWSGLQKAIAGSSGDSIEIKFVRDGKELEKSILPKIIKRKDKDGQEIESRVIGIAPNQEMELELFRFGLRDSFAFAGEELMFITVLTYESLYRMITGAMSAKESVTGPIGIFYIVKGAAESGISHLLFVLGVISASLAIFNLLPVIPLDGGHIFLLMIEKIRGRALPPNVDEYVARIGFSLIVLLAMFVFYSDLVRWGWFESIGNMFGQIKSVFP